MTDLIDIAALVRQTGLTSRALRFYEARGMLRPLRTHSGRRLYGPADIARLHQLLALRRAGFTLSQIGQMVAGRAPDLGAMLRAQLSALDQQVQALDDARRHLHSALSRVDRGEPLDTATLCSLIKYGDDMTEQKRWKAISDRYISAEAEADYAQAQEHMPADFDQAAYAARWTELGARIETAQPLDPAGPQAAAFLAEWEALLAPFTAVATPAMREGAARIHDHIDEWKDEVAPPFSAAVWAFIKAAAAARQSQPGQEAPQL